MKLAAKLGVPVGIMVAASAALLGSIFIQGAVVEASHAPGGSQDATAGQPLPGVSPEERVRQAVEEAHRQAQAALEELGTLDSPEKMARAQEILNRLQQTIREIQKRAHSPVTERYDERHDLAVARLHVAARAETRQLGQPDSAEARRRAQEIAARTQQRQEELEAQRSRMRERLEGIHQQQPLPRLDVRPPSGRPPEHAPAHGLRVQQGALSPEEAEVTIRRLEAEARAALDRLGELDTPGKVEMARKIRASLAERIREVRARVAGQVEVDNEAEQRLEQQIQRLRQRLADALRDLGPLDTPEKERHAAQLRARFEEQIRQLKERFEHRSIQQSNPHFEEEARELRRQAQDALRGLGDPQDPANQEKAQDIRDRLDEQLSAARERVPDPGRLALEEQWEREAQALRRRAQAALDALGELDTPEKQETARRIRAGLEQQLQQLLHQLARGAHATTGNDQYHREVAELRRQAQEALSRLGRLDTPEKIQMARQIHARLEEAIKRLQAQHAMSLREGLGSQFETRPATRPARPADTAADSPSAQTRPLAPDRQDSSAAEARAREAQALREAQAARERQEAQAREAERREALAREAAQREAATRQPTPTPEPTREPTDRTGEDSTSDDGSRDSTSRP